MRTKLGVLLPKNNKVRYYECEFDDEGDLTYNEVQVKKDSDVKVDINVNPRIWICEFTKREMWEVRVADTEKVAVVICRRSKHKVTKLKAAGRFIRNNIFVMDLDEYNDSYVLLRSKSRYLLNHLFMIISYMYV